MQPVSLLLPEAPVPPFKDGVQASSVAQGQAFPGAATTVHGLPLPGNAIHASRSDNGLLGAPSAPEPLRGAVQAPSDKGPSYVSTPIVSNSSDVTTGSTGGSPESAAELSATITRLRVTVNALAASISVLCPAALPALHSLNAALAAAASQDHEESSPESRRKLLNALTELSYQLGCLASSCSGVSAAVSPSPAACELPEFRGFQDDADHWVATVNALGARQAWTDQRKWCVAIDRLRHAAAAWHRFEGVRQQSWAEWSFKLIAAFGRTPSNFYATTEANLTATEDGAQEENHLEAATAHCSSPAGSLTTCPGTHIPPKPGAPLPAPVSDTIPSRIDAETTSHSQRAPTRPLSWSALERTEPSACCLTSVSSQQVGNNGRTATPYSTLTWKSQPRKSRQSLAECASVSLAEANANEFTIVEHLAVSSRSPDDNMAGPIDADGVGIDNSGYMACEPADDATHFVLTTGVPPERRADQDEAVLVATGLTTDPSDSHRRAKEYDDREGDAALSNNDDPVPLPVRVRTRSALRKSSPALHANADKDQSVKLRRHNDCLLGVRRPLHHGQGRPPDPLTADRRAKPRRCRQLRLPRKSQFRQQETNEPASRAMSQYGRDQHSKLASPKFQAKPQRGRDRLQRFDQCRPPEALRAGLPNKLQRGRTRPPRCSQHRPPETLSDGPRVAVMAECDDEKRHRGWRAGGYGEAEKDEV